MEVHPEGFYWHHCRFCAQIKPNNELLMFLSDEEAVNIVFKFMQYIKMNLDISCQNNLPKTVCKNCLKNIFELNNIISNIEQAQFLLNSIYIKKEICNMEEEVKIEYDQSFMKNDIDFDKNPLADNNDKVETKTQLIEDHLTSNRLKEFPIDSLQSHKLGNVAKIKEKKVLKNVEQINKNISTDDSWSGYTWICVYCKVELHSLDDIRIHCKELHKKCHGYSCADCKEWIPMFNFFVDHARQHRPILRYYCQYCNQKFDSPVQCIEHSLTHKQGKIQCELCGELMENPTALNEHKELYKKVRFQIRPKRVIKGDTLILENGVEASWSDYKWACRECNETLPNADVLRRHFREVHNKCFAMKCMDCTMGLRNFGLFVNHVRVHRPYLKNYCHYCNENVKGLSLNQHVKIHENSPKKLCPGCGYIFENESMLHEHMKQYNAPRPAKSLTLADLTCDICGKVCSKLGILWTHKKIHNSKKERNHTCCICGKSFSNRDALNNHCTHTHKEKSYICKVCNRAFSRKTHLQEHVATHLKEKPFQCNDCGKGFNTKHRLKYHMKLHSGMKPHACKVCNKSFKYKVNLNVHSRQHTGLKPYACDICERPFTNWGNMNKHMMTMHGISRKKNSSKIEVDDETKEWIETLIPKTNQRIIDENS